MAKLAINGGKPIRTKPFEAYNTIGEEEKKAVLAVLDSGYLSRFLAGWTEDKMVSKGKFNAFDYSCDFFGGKYVREFEKMWGRMFDVNHAISVNSCTTGLFAAIGAAGITAGDEVIVSPFTMSASASCVMGYGGVPVFADVQKDIFTLDPDSIKKKITPLTKAIVVVHLFGHPANMDPIMEIAKENELIVIEDCAQAPLARYNGKLVGSIGDIGVFSLNFHKHIHTGEGGVLTTNNDDLAKRIYLIRNHGEMATLQFGIKDYTNLWGTNYRFTEIQAAIGIEQLKKLNLLIEKRINNCNYLGNALSHFKGIQPPVVYDRCRHVYYIQPFLYDQKAIGVERNKFIMAVASELPCTRLRETAGKLIWPAYVNPLYMQGIYQDRKNPALPFNSPLYKGRVKYGKGICSVTEDLNQRRLFCNEYMQPNMLKQDLDDVLAAFEKVYTNKSELK